MTDYDYIFVGAGVAGLTTARAIARRQPDVALAMIDPRLDRREHHTFGYWYEGDSLLPEQVGRSWNRWTISAPGSEVVVDLGQWRYETFELQAWKDAVTSELDALADVSWIDARVAGIDEDRASVTVETGDARTLNGRWVFDSRPCAPPDGAKLVLWQSFRGQQLRLDDDAEIRDVLRLMDFRRRPEVVEFEYVVPLDDRTVFVESVLASRTPPEGKDDFELESYIAEHFPDHEVVATEGGRTALTTANYERRAGQRTVNIGLRGGAARPSTGYAFVDIHREAEAIADALVETGEPWGRSGRRRRDQFLDGVLLTLLAEHPERAPDVFVQLFQNARTDRVLRLLDNRATWPDIVAVAWALPWILFLRAFWAWLVRYR